MILRESIREGSFRLYDRVASTYERLYFNEETLSLDKPFLDRFVYELPSKPKVLDIGCGLGIEARYLSEKGVLYTGIDASHKMISIARKRNPAIRFEIMDMRHILYEESRFDGVMSLGGIIHFPKSELPNLLDEFARVMTKDGVMLLGVEEGRGKRFMEFGLGLKDEVLVSLYSLTELSRVLRKFGFRVVFHARRAPFEDEFPFVKLNIIARRMAVAPHGG